MKILSALIIAIILSFSASAKEYKLDNFKPASTVATLTPPSRTINSNWKTQVSCDGGRREVSIPGIVNPSDLEGPWFVTFGDYYFQSSFNTDIKVEFYAFLDNENEIYFEDPTEYEWPFMGVFDKKTDELVFDVFCLGTYEQYYVYQMPYVITGENNLTLTPIRAKYDKKADRIDFGEKKGIIWAACTEEDPNTMERYLNIYDLIVAERPEEEAFDEEQEGQWESVGTATFEDGWVFPAIKEWGAEHPMEVELQRNVEDANIYRLWRPYWNEDSPLFEKNKSQYEGQIVFDISDPDHVIFPPGMPAGFKDNSIGEFFVSNWLGWYMNYYQISKEEAIEKLKNGTHGVFDTFKDGVVSIGSSSIIWDVNSECRYGYSWTSMVQAAKIIFNDDIDSLPVIVPDCNDTDAPEYYNMQGVRVQDADAGQLLIKKSGNTVKKIIVK